MNYASDPSARPLIDLLFFDAGGGHRASATALKSVIEPRYRDWNVRMVNLRDVLASIDLIDQFTGIRVENVYNRLLKYGLTIGTGPMLRTVQLLIRALHTRVVNRLAEHWRALPPDLVVSVIPNFNRQIFEGLRAADESQARPGTPMATILTDMADYPPHFWIEPQEQYVICGTELAVKQALAMGHAADRVYQTSGMIVRPEFYTASPVVRELERDRMGLRRELPTGLVMFGGFGSRRMLSIAKRIAELESGIQLIFMCGHNDRLRERLTAMNLPFPHHICGFTSEVPRYMQLADFLIGKPGPGSLSEALVMGLPVIVERNAFTMVQERFNTDWIAQNNIGVVLRSFDDIAQGVAEMGANLAWFRSRVRAQKNRAVFEIPEILESIMSRHAPSTSISSRREFEGVEQAG